MTLTWRVTGAERTQLALPSGTTSVASAGSLTVEGLTETTAFRLEARSRSESDVRTVWVEIDDQRPPSIDQFSVTPLEGEPGAELSVRWSTRRARRVTLESPGGATPGLPPEGRATVVVPIEAGAEMGLTLVAAGSAGETRAELQVPVRRPDDPRILRFDATPSRLLVTESAELRWQVEDADDVQIWVDGEPWLSKLTPTGFREVNPEVTTRYELVARRTGAATVARAEARVQVDPSPLEIISFAPKSKRVPEGTDVELRWSVTAHDRLVLTDSNDVEIDVTGPGRARVEQTARSEVYTLTVERDRDDGVLVETATTVAFVDPPPRAAELIVAPPVVTSEPVDVTWRVENAVYANLFIDGRLAPGFPRFDGRGEAQVVRSGTLRVAGLSEALLSLEVENAAGRSVLERRMYTPKATISSSVTESLFMSRGEAEAWIALDVPPGYTVQVDPELYRSVEGPIFVDERTLPRLRELALFDARGLLVAQDFRSGPVDSPRLHADLQPGLRSLSGGSYYLRLRRAAADSAANLSLRVVFLRTNTCGNTILDPGEGCDPGPDNTRHCLDCTFLGVDEPPSPGALHVSGPRTVIRGLISTPTGGAPDEDVYTVDVEAGDDLRLRATVGSYVYCPDIPVTLEVWDASGTQLLARATRDRPQHGFRRPGESLFLNNDYVRYLREVPSDGCVVLGPGPGTDDESLRRFGYENASLRAFWEPPRRDYPQASSRLEDMAPGRYQIRIRASDPASGGLHYFLHVEKQPALCGNGIREARGGEDCDIELPNSGLPDELFSCRDCRWTGPTAVFDGPGTFTTTVSPVQLDSRSPLGLEVEVTALELPPEVSPRSILGPVAHVFGPQRLSAVPWSWSRGENGGLPVPLDPGRSVLAWGTLEQTFLAPDFPLIVYPSEVTIRTYELDICGNGVLEPYRNETCDDGNRTDGDGCSSTCQLADLLTVPLSNPQVEALQVPSGGERLIAFDIPSGRSGRLERVRTASVAGSPCEGELALVYVLPKPSLAALIPTTPAPAACLEGSLEMPSLGAAAYLDNPARNLAPGRHLVRIENRGSEPRTVDLELTIALDACGDGVLDLGAGEECDDGNRASGDQCPSDCRLLEPDVEGPLEPNNDLDHAVDLGSDGPLGNQGLVGPSRVRIKGRVDGTRFAPAEVDDPVDVYAFDVPPGGGPLDFDVKVYGGASPLFCESWGEDFHVNNLAGWFPMIRWRLFDGEGRLVTSASARGCESIGVPELEPGTWYLEVRANRRSWVYQLELSLEVPR